MAENKDNPSYCSQQYLALKETWELCADVEAGERALKAKGEKYLRRFPLELRRVLPQGGEYDPYKDRLADATTHPFFADTLDRMTGLTFHQPIEFDGVPEQIKSFWDNIDNEGTNGDVFCQNAYKDFLRDGYGFIIISVPSAAGIENATDERAANLRAYWGMRTPIQANNAQFKVINGVKTLSQITFREETIEAKPGAEFEEETVVRFRTWKLVGQNGNYTAMWTLKRERKREGSNEYDYITEATGVVKDAKGNVLSEIPVAIIGKMYQPPPFENLARLNVRHRKTDSEYSRLLPHVGVVNYVREGVTKEERKDSMQAIGANVLHDVPIGGDVRVNETTGAAMQVHERALDRLERYAETMSFKMTMEQRPQKTATESALETVKETSRMQVLRQQFIDGVNKALYFTALIEGLPSGGAIKLNVELPKLTSDGGDATQADKKMPMEKGMQKSEMVS